MANLRSQTDFTQLTLLGRGAFGEVSLCKNKIDGQLYAVKRIKVPPHRREKVLREARLLSSLTHSRIVRYYQCWMEEVEEDVVEEEHEKEAGEAGASASPPPPAAAVAAAAESPLPHGGPQHSAPLLGTRPAGAGTAPSTAPPDGADAVVAAGTAPSAAQPDGSGATPVVPRLVCSICSERYVDWSVAFSAWTALDASLQPLNLCTNCYKLALINLGFDLSRIHITFKDGAAGGATPLTQAAPKTVVAVSYLYIQTEFCERTLLEECVEITNRAVDTSSPRTAAGLTPKAEALIWQLFWEIVEGLAYLHAAKVVHRDLKPSNIFSKAGCAKIGDLGLATTISAQSAPPVDELAQDLNCTGGVGLGRAGGLAGSSKQKPVRVYPSPSPASPVVPGGGSRSRSLLGVVHETAEGEVDEDEAATEAAGQDKEQQQLHRRNELLVRRLEGEAAGARFSSSSSSSNSPIMGGGGHSSGAGGGQDRSQEGGKRGGTTGGVGTYFYMAPETLAHRESQPGQEQALQAGAAATSLYSEKSDLYALGVILFEMFSAHRIAAASSSERAVMLGALKRGAVPRHFIYTFPVQSQLIANLMQADPRARPTASDLLRYRYFVWSPAMFEAGLPIDTQEGPEEGADGEGTQAQLHPLKTSAGLTLSKARRFLHMSLPADDGAAAAMSDGAAGDEDEGAHAAPGGKQQLPAPPSPRLSAGGPASAAMTVSGVDLRTADAGTLRSLLGQALTTIGEQSATIGQLKGQLQHKEAALMQTRAQLAAFGRQQQQQQENVLLQLAAYASQRAAPHSPRHGSTPPSPYGRGAEALQGGQGRGGMWDALV